MRAHVAVLALVRDVLNAPFARLLGFDKESVHGAVERADAGAVSLELVLAAANVRDIPLLHGRSELCLCSEGVRRNSHGSVRDCHGPIQR